MKQQKLLVCLLSTSLLIPSFPINDVNAETSEKSTTASQSNDAHKDKEQDKEQSKPSESDQSHSSQNSHTEKETSDDAKDTSNDDDNAKDKSNDDKQNSEQKQNRTNNETPNDGTRNASHKNDRHTSSDKVTPNSTENTWDVSASDYRSNLLDMFKPAPLKRDNHSLSELLDQLFSNNDTMRSSSPIEQNDAQNEDSNNQTTYPTSIDQTDPEDTNTIDANGDDDGNADDPEENNEDTSQEQDNTNNNDIEDTTHQSENNDMDDGSDSNKLTDAKNQQHDDTELDSQQKQSHENANRDDDNLNDQQNETPKRDNNVKTGDQSDSSSDDKVLEAILDEYSEDAKNNQKQYYAQKESASNEDADDKKSSSDKQTSNNQANPQLPSKSQLAKKEKPTQSFEHDINQSDIRSTAVFQQWPNLSDDDNAANNITITENKNTRDFIKNIAQDAHDIGQNEDIYASVMIAQAILESDSGMSMLARSPHFNLFGIKGTYEGKSAKFNTLEDNGNNTFQISANFRSYPSEKESLEDYATLIKQGIDGNQNIYKPTWKSEAHSYRSATAHLATTYATDSQYADKLNSIIKHYDLTQLDHKQMPNLDDYKVNNDNDDSDFKPFSETTNDTPYPHGQCTWYVYNRMAQFDQFVSGDLGDARNWNNRAERKGYTVASTPKAHTAVVFEAGQQGADAMYGHVAFVEKVNDDGSIIISESNVKGLGVVSYRTIDADDAKELSYITGKNN
ncbi:MULTISPECIES: amidase domain-containing protein [Staphylococcus]|uniref:amidase domain-containing protein n=1 Tax=Staphylococcus TaxID=1279 RepID=UPI000E693E78|nr:MULTISPECIES: amidase domain-containing protein [Staphylococcus]RIO40251.1 amidase domain-containing protein [Staphylococcus nepalensis]WQL20326.1 amidase domain-containing protein [Staphylococcus nepalensis]